MPDGVFVVPVLAVYFSGAEAMAIGLHARMAMNIDVFFHNIFYFNDINISNIYQKVTIFNETLTIYLDERIE
jgi:hypothetical protein